MKLNIYKIFTIILIFFYFSNKSTTLVYSLRIRRQFDLANLKKVMGDKRSLLLTSVVPIIHKEKRDIIDESLFLNLFEKSVTYGSLLNFRYLSRKRWWAELTTGIEKESMKLKDKAILPNICIERCRTGFDDFVFSLGYNLIPFKNAQLVFFGIGGVPSKTTVTKREAQNRLVGTRFYSLGAGTEFSYNFKKSLEQSLIGLVQFRFLHFFTRKWAPILPENGKIQPGNIIDVLLTFQYRNQKTVFEIGYNPTFFTNQAIILNNEKFRSQNFVRKGLYVSFSQLFEKLPVIDKPGLIGLGVSFSNSDKYNARIKSAWLNFSTAF